MSMTSCWATKNSEMLHDDDGHAAEGSPNVEGSMLLPPFVIDDGIALLCAERRASERSKSGSRRQRDSQSRTRC